MTAEEILLNHGHLPWPLPRRPWIMRQQWNRLLFAHWALPPEALRPLVPAELALDSFEGRCWVAVTPFHLSGLRPPGLSFGGLSFPELNVRTYVTRDGKPGVYFFSLDAGSVMAVFGARTIYGLPYFYARMKIEYDSDAVRYQCRRSHLGIGAEFQAHYRPVSPPRTSMPGTLEHFLTERYCLYAVEAGRVYRAQIHHLPWPLQAAEAEISRNTMAAAAGIRLPDSTPLLHFARALEVLVWAPERLK
ncbi:MAG: YqjF family protein [Terriglobales bacterium]